MFSHCFRCPLVLSSGAARPPRSAAGQGAGLFRSLPLRDAPEEIADRLLKVTEGAPALETARQEGGSPYRKLFRNGATLFPRLFVFVERKQMGRLAPIPAPPLS